MTRVDAGAASVLFITVGNVAVHELHPEVLDADLPRMDCARNRLGGRTISSCGIAPLERLRD
jgi:hypothetical protein